MCKILSFIVIDFSNFYYYVYIRILILLSIILFINLISTHDLQKHII